MRRWISRLSFRLRLLFAAVLIAEAGLVSWLVSRFGYMWILLAAVAGLALALMAEAACALYYARNPGQRARIRRIFNNDEAVDSAWKSLNAVRFHPFYQMTGRPGARASADAYDRIDAAGFRATRDTSTTAPVIYVAGDCTVFDAGLAPGDTFGHCLQAALRNAGQEQSVVKNAAMLHYSSIHCLNRLVGDLLRTGIDAVNLHVGINDVLAFLHTGGCPEPDYSRYYKSASRDLVDALASMGAGGATRCSRAATMVVQVALGVGADWKEMRIDWESYTYNKSSDWGSAENLEKARAGFHTKYFEHYLGRFAATCRDSDLPLIIGTICTNRDDMKTPARAFLQEGIDEFNEVIRGLDVQPGMLRVFDYEAELPGITSEVSRWLFTPTGNRRRAAALSDYTIAMVGARQPTIG